MVTGIVGQLTMIALASRTEIVGLAGAIAASAALYPVMTRTFGGGRRALATR
jgi:hypothetical protein